MAEQNITTALGDAAAIDFVEQFNTRLNSFTQLVGLNRRVTLSVGSTLKTYRSEVDLTEGSVGPGAMIPLSEVKLTDGPTIELAWDKKRKAVTMEDVQKYGYERAVALTDTALLNAVQRDIRSRMITQLGTGTATAEGTGLQQVLARAWAGVTTAFDEDDAEAISFINPFDAAEYLGDAAISTQTAFGMNYLEGFLNNRVVFMSADIPQGTTYTTASGNLVFAHAAMTAGALGQAFDFTTDESGIIGVTHDINKQRLQTETITAYGLVLFAEILDGVVVGTIAAPDADPEA